MNPTIVKTITFQGVDFARQPQGPDTRDYRLFRYTNGPWTIYYHNYQKFPWTIRWWPRGVTPAVNAIDGFSSATLPGAWAAIDSVLTMINEDFPGRQA